MKNNKRKIVASLTYGKPCSKWALWVLFIMAIAYPLLALAIAVEGVINGVFQERLWGFLTLLLLFLLALPLLLYFGEIDRKIRLYVKDGVELTANSKQIAVGSTAEERWSVTLPIKIRVRFKYNGESREQVSGEKIGQKKGHVLQYVMNGFKSGFSTVFIPYADRKIKILYSPKYDEVLILAD